VILPKVLIVDDNLDLGEGLKAILEDEDYDVTLALTGEEAVSLSREQKFDFTVMDVQLPGINGIDAIMEIRSIRPDANMMVMSGFRIEQLLAEALNKDKVSVLRKPSTTNQVLAALGDFQSADIVLIVDDNPDTVSNIELFLKSNNYRAVVAHNEHEALDPVHLGDAQLLILDLQLPVLKGLEVFIKLQDQGRAVPTILVTGYPPEELGTVDELHSLSVTGCLFKPFKPEQLLQGLASLSGVREASR
jgi:two-component system response regulator HydG